MLKSYRVGHVLWHTPSCRKVIALGNAAPNGKLWCADYTSLVSEDIALADLESRPEFEPHDWDSLVSRIEARGAEGDSQALWWAAWAWEGMNHPKSVWYYIAAIRCNPRRHGWVLSRLYADAHSAYMQKDVPKPSLTFLKKIKEFTGVREFGAWQEAVKHAQKAVHRPARNQSPRPGPRAYKVNPNPANR